MGKWVKRIVVGVIALSVFYAVGGSVATALLLNHLLTPGKVDWTGSGTPPTDPFELGYRGDPKTALGLDFEVVRYDTDLGPAEAWLVPGAQPQGPWAVYVHGIGGIRENGYKQLSILNEAGIPTLMITYRNDSGAPASPNPVFSFGMTEWRDLDAAVTWLLGRGAPSVIVAAESMGGGIAGQFLMHSAQVDKIEALALDAPALDLAAVVVGRVQAMSLPFGPELAWAGLGLFDRFRQSDLSAAVSLEAVVRFPRPLFLAHGARDSLVPVGISDRLVAERTAPTTFVRTEADHLLSFKEDPARYREAMLGWLRTLPR